MSDVKSTFYSELTSIEKIIELTNPDYYVDVPRDWLIALTDVRGSTVAIENGRYKDVNAVAAASIAAMLNVVKGLDIPYVFGGDGASILVPPEFRERTREVLAATRNLSRDYFDLELRVGIVPVRDVLIEGYDVRVAKMHVSDNFQQAIFMGGGISHAEYLFKHEIRGKLYAVDFEGEPQANFDGFECRWNAVPSKHDETISIMVIAQGNSDQQAVIYDDVLHNIELIYGTSDHRHPITVENMKLAMNPNKLITEAKIRYQDISLRRLLGMLQNSIKAAFAMWANIGQWGTYKELFINSTDHEKFDDALRMTISGTEAQRDTLDAYLHQMHAQGQLVFGTHVASHALVTCIVFDYFGQQVHFVDSADGGYALAAKQLKAQLAQLTSDVRAVS